MGRRLRPRYRVRPRLFVILGVIVLGVVLLAHHPAHRAAHAPLPRRSPPATVHVAAPAFGWYPDSLLPSPLQGLAVALAGSDLLVAGGLNAQGSSAAITGFGPLPVVASLSRPVHDAAAVAIGATLYVLGGGSAAPGAQVQAVSLNGSAPATPPSLPEPLADMASATTPRGFVVVGGYTGSGYVSTVAVWTPGHLTTLAHLPLGLRYAAAAWYRNRLVVAGGLSATGPVRSVYAVDLTTGAVSPWPSLPESVYHAGLAVFDHHLVLVGGEVAGTPVRSVYVYEAASRTWVPGPELPTPTADGAVASFQGHLWYIGGFTSSGPTNQVWVAKPLARAR